LPLALLACAVVWLALRQNVLTIDSYYYLWDVEFGSWHRLWHPHHLGLEPLLRGYWNVWGWFAWPHRAVLPLQLLSLAAMLLSLALAARLLRVLLGRTRAVVLWWSLLALSYQAWYFATQTEVGPYFALLGTALLLWAARLPRGEGEPPAGMRQAWLLAGTLVVAILVHQSFVLAAPLLVAMLVREAPAGRRSVVAGVGLGVPAVVVAAAYVGVGAWVTGSLEPAGLWRWMTRYHQEFAHCCGDWRLLLSADVPRGLGAAFFSGDPLTAYVYGDRAPDAALVVRALPPVLVAVVLAVGLVRLPAAWLERDRAGRRALLNVAVVTLVAALFAGWWEPGNRKFWVPVVPGLVALAAAGWCAWRHRWPGSRHLALVALLAVMGGYNLAGGMLPRHRQDDATQPLVEFVVRRTDARDAVVLLEDRLWQCVTYWAPGRTVHGLPGPHSDRADPERSVLRAAANDAARALREGSTLYVSATAWPHLRAQLIGTFPEMGPPVPVLDYGDADLGGRDQTLLAIRLPVL
jgi:hypothetical protein